MIRIAVIVATSAFAFAAEPIALPGVRNAFRVTPDVFSGSHPEGDAAFAALAKLGVKTIISVDGAKPQVAAARKHGLRYIHLPIGYDSVPFARQPELAAAAGSEKVFVHCHHGNHRGPAAVAIICQTIADWTPTTAEAWMREAGTGEDYAGLYRSVRDFRPPTKAQLAKVGPLPEVAKTPQIVDAMVAMDAHLDALKSAHSANHATLLWEQLRELGRLDDEERTADFRAKLAESEKAAAALRKAIDPKTALKSIEQTCAACHKDHRK